MESRGSCMYGMNDGITRMTSMALHDAQPPPHAPQNLEKYIIWKFDSSSVPCCPLLYFVLFKESESP